MRYLVLFSVFLISSCSWFDGMRNWANTNMPTYDGSRPGLEQQPQQQRQSAQPPAYQGSQVPPASQMRAPVPGAAAVPQPGAAVPAPQNFNAATTPSSMPREPDYYDPMIPAPPI